MFEKKKLVSLLAVALLAACGGGGGDDTNNLAASGDGTRVSSGSQNGPEASSSPQSPAGDAVPPPGDLSSVPPAPAPVAADQRLQGELAMVGNQLVYIKADRPDVYWATSLADFEGQPGMHDIASGSTGNEPNAVMMPSALAPAAPIAAFGFRVDKVVQATADTPTVGGQTAVGRVAFNLTEISGSAGIGANEVAEQMRFVIDQVALSTNAQGELSARVLDGAQMHVEGRNAAGVAVSASIPVPADAVRMQDMAQVLDVEGDTSSVVLMIDLEKAFSQAGTQLAALENIKGHFAMQVTLSSAQMAGTQGTPATPRPLLGAPVTVGSQPAVTGAGISGSVWIRAYP